MGDVYIEQKNEALTEMLGAQMTWNHGYEGEREVSEDKSVTGPKASGGTSKI